MSFKKYWKQGVQILFILAIISFTYVRATANMTEYFVSPQGNDNNSGAGSTEPFLTLQHALSLAQPGDIIHLAPGDYYQDVRSVRSGTQDAPITIRGSADAILRGADRSRLFEINHDYLTLEGFTINGLHGDPNHSDGYRDKLLFVHGQQERRGVVGLRVLNMRFENAGGECVRLRYFVQNSEIAHSTFHNCGVHDFVFGEGGKNGEAIYIGTSSKQWGDGKNPTADPDESNNNWIHHNVFVTNGNECVETKEGASENIIEHNDCSGQRDPNSGGFGLRGSGNILRHNRSYNNVGAGVRIGGHQVDGIQYGQQNDVYNNEIFNNQTGGIKFQIAPQGRVCGNVMSGNNGGDNVGKYGDQFAAAANCGGNEPPVEPPTPPAEEPEPIQTTSLTVTASSHDGNVPENVLDNDTRTRWSAQGDGEWLMADLGQTQIIDRILLSFHKGTQRVAFFDIEISEDGAGWVQVLRGQSSGLTNDWQQFDFTAVSARYVRVVGYGNSANNWNSLTELAIPVDDVPPSPTAQPSPTATPIVTVEPTTTIEPTATIEPTVIIEPTATVEPTVVPTLEPTATPMAGSSGYQLVAGNNWFEAEAHTNEVTGHWIVAEDGAASNGRYMHLDTGKENRKDLNDILEYTFHTEYSGPIFVWYRGIKSPKTDHGIYIQLDDGRLNRADLFDDTWTWYLDDNTDEWEIEPGQHSIRIYNRFEQSKIDKILITTDPNYVPQGTGE